MHTNRLIDAIVRQTTVLIAQLTAAAGIRAPLTHLADEVFLSLSRELEDQGVSRKVVADMFGLALRSYQRRVQRISESQTEGGRTLWQCVFEHLQANGPVTRAAVLERFRRDDPEAVGAVLNDLVRSGLLSRTGGGGTTVFSPTPPETWRLMDRQGREDTAAALVWLEICRHPGASPAEVATRLGMDAASLEAALKRLEQEERLTCDEQGHLQAREAMVIPVGSEQGWEVAVFDHFQAVVGALVAKLRLGAGSAQADTTGGTTLTFELHAAHPLTSEVLGLLARFRAETDDLWDRVEAVNAEERVPEDEMSRVVFYFGQFIKQADGEGKL